MGLSLDGLVSGLDTTALITSLMDVEAIPRNLLSAKVTDKNGIIAQLQKLNTSVQSLAGDAKTAAGAGLTRYTASASSPAVSVSADTDASPISAEMVVDRLAGTHTVVSAAFATWSADAPTFVIEGADGEQVEVTAASGSARDVAEAINGAGAGVSATVVAAGTDADGTPLHRLNLRATASGADGAFRVYEGDLAAVAAGAPMLSDAPGAAVVAEGEDAQVRLWAGTDAEQTITSSQNTFEDLFDGVSITVGALSPTPVTVTVAADAEATADSAAAFVDQVADILTRIANGSKATIADTAGEATTLGVFTGDSTVRSLGTALTGAVQHPVDGVSPSSIGISVDRHGVLTFDRERFTAALSEDPDRTQAVFSQLAGRVADTADSYADKYDGMLTMRITGQQNEVRSLDDQISHWDVRLAQRKASLERQYSHLETMLSQLQSQSDYLQSQLAGLPGTKDAS